MNFIQYEKIRCGTPPIIKDHIPVLQIVLVQVP
jgi:hypothetical protein